jgi:hypothetical protein
LAAVLHVVVRCALAAVLLAAAAAKLRRPEKSRSALGGLVGGSARSGESLLVAVVAVELTLAVGVAAGSDGAALLAALFLGAGAAVLVRALRAGRAGTPCGCFGARSRVGGVAVARALVLAAAFAALPLVPRDDLSSTTWLTIGLAVALAALVALGVAVLALAREVGMLRLAVGPQAALEIPEEGPPVGSDSGLAAALDPRPGGPELAVAVFSSDGCRLCQALAPSIAAFGRDPHVEVLELDEVRDGDHWRRLGVPGSPYAVAIDRGGQGAGQGDRSTRSRQLESVVATGERRMRPGARA